MMRQISQEFKNRLNQSLTFLSKAWIITPNQGEIIRVCEHDRDIEIAGHVFSALNNIEGGSVEIQNSMGPDRSIISGALKPQGISRLAVQKGHFDNAKVQLLIFDWKALQYFVEVWAGIVTRTILHDFGFEFEIAGPETLFNQIVGRKFTRHCAAKLGDANCGLNLNSANHVFSAEISKVNSAIELIIQTTDDFEANHFSGGEIQFQSGALNDYNAKISTIMKANEILVVLQYSLPIDPEIGDEVKVFIGCDKLFETCKNRFQNAANFFGFPNMPGEGIIYASP